MYQEYFPEKHEEPKQARNDDGKVDVERVRKALDCIPADDYKVWIDIGMGLKAGGLPIEIWDEWSQKSPKYDPEICAIKWETFNGNRIGLGTVYHHAQQHGFKFPAGSPTNGAGHEQALPARQSVPMWPKLNDAALIGLIGEFVNKAAEGSEADPAAILLNLLPLLGCIIGPDTFLEIGDDKHPPRLSTLTVGASARGRKGTAAAAVKKLAKIISVLFAELAVRVSPGPLSSGEGIIFAVRDASEEKDDAGNPIDPGAKDKRLFVLSSEFASALTVMKREGNTLGTTLRALFDDGDVDTLTKNNRTKATGAHVCVTSHITKEELLKKLPDTEIYSGTMNRFLLGCVRRSKQVDDPKPLDRAWLEEFAVKISNRLSRAKKAGSVLMTDDARLVWKEIYPALTEDEPGLVGALTSRSEVLTKRVAALYAAVDEFEDRVLIDVCHLRAALAVIEFSRNSARFLYGAPEADNERDRLCRRILNAVATKPTGITQTELQNALNRNIDADKLWRAIAHLQDVGKLTQTQLKTEGRPRTVLRLTAGFTLAVDELNGK